MNNRGFTLLEILIALTVFAILSVITATAMHQAFNTRERLNKQADQLNKLQIAVTQIQRDTQQIIKRPILGTEMHTFAPFIGQPTYIEFTKDGIANPLATAQQSALQRIAFLCDANQLIRRKWHSIDTPKRNQYQDKTLLTSLSACSFSYIAHNQQTFTEWQAYALQQNQSDETFPMLIQLNIKTNWGKMSLLFKLPEINHENER